MAKLPADPDLRKVLLTNRDYEYSFRNGGMCMNIARKGVIAVRS